MIRKKRITYAQMEAGLNPMRDFGQKWYRYVDPIDYVLACKEITGLADWKIARDMSVDSGVEVSGQVVGIWRRKGGG